MNRLPLTALLLVLALFTTSCSEDKSSAGLAKNEMVPASAYVPVSGNGIYNRPDACESVDTKTGKSRYVDAKLHKIIGKCKSDPNKGRYWAYYGQRKKPATLKKWLKRFCKKKYKSAAITIIDVDERQCHSGSGAYNVAAVGYVNKYKAVLTAFKKSGTELSKSAWGKDHYCKTGRKKRLKYPGLSAKTCKSSGDGSSGESSNGGTFTKTDYQFVYKRNAAHFGGRTVRWASKTINVSGITNPSWQAAIRKWPVVSFKFGSNKGIVFAGYSNKGAGLCGWAQPMWRSNGKMARCTITLHAPFSPARCGSIELVLQHEVGHCLGIMGHTNDGGLMDPVCCSSKITSPVRRGLALLYSLPPGTKIRSKARARAGSASHNKSKAGQDDLFDPSGERLIYGPVIATQARQ